MFKSVANILAGIIIGVLVAYLTMQLKEEDLSYSITAPATFGEINYQNIAITNSGWEPATNIKIKISHRKITLSNIQTEASIAKSKTTKEGVELGIERIRRDETIVLSFAYAGAPLGPKNIKISSDRAIAKYVELDEKESIPYWITIISLIFASVFVGGVIASMFIPAYRGYIERANELEAQKNKSISNK